MAEPSSLFRYDTPVNGSPAKSEEVRNNFRALAQTNYGTDPTKPEFFAPGMLRILANDPNNIKLQAWLLDTPTSTSGDWRTVAQYLGTANATTSKSVVEFTAASNPWVVTHNKGSKPLVQVFTSAGVQKEVVSSGPAAGQYVLQHLSDNQFQVTHNAAAVGYVILVG